MFGSIRLVLSWPRDVKLREQHPFLVATSLMSKQTCVTIATWDYQRWIKHFSPSHSLASPLTDRVFLFNIRILLLLL